MSMPTDHPALHRVAWLVLASACAPSVRPVAPPGEPEGVVRHIPSTARPGATAGHVMVGEMCPQGAAGRPAIAPLMVRTVGWSDSAADVSNAVERGSFPRFAVLDADGKQAGVFDTVGVADIGLEQSVAAGAYVGAGPCTRGACGGTSAPPTAPASKGVAQQAPTTKAASGPRVEDTTCTVALGGCGIALAEQRHPDDDDPKLPAFSTGGACLSGDTLAVDVDGDGVLEAFPLASVLDGIRTPANEWSAAPTAGAACTPSFQLYDVKLVAPPEPGKAIDPKATVVMDVMGVVDLDSDGRNELVIAFRFPTVRTIAVYSAVASPQRLELVGENQSFTR